jgi:hypothetical protein
MELTILRLIILLFLLIIPLRGPSQRRRIRYMRPDKIITCSNYGINEDGKLEKVNKENKEE